MVLLSCLPTITDKHYDANIIMPWIKTEADSDKEHNKQETVADGGLIKKCRRWRCSPSPHNTWLIIFEQ